MPARLTHKDVEASFAKEGYTLLSQYINSRTKLKFICFNGHTHSITWDNFRSNKRCGKCPNPNIKTLKKDTEEVFKEFAERGYVLLSPYKNSKTKIRFICPDNHMEQMTLEKFSQGVKCIRCAKQKVTQEDAIELFTSNNCILLSVYVNSKSKLKFVCPENHINTMTYNSFSQSKKCSMCVKPLMNIDKAKKAFEARGYKLLSTTYHYHQPLEFICPNGHQFHIKWSAFNKGCDCAKCDGRYKTPEELEARKLKYKLRSQLSSRLTKITKKGSTIEHCTSKNKEAAKIANALYQKLGGIPNGYEIDHIIPASFFNLLNESEFKACWHIENLQYLTQKENSVKRNRLSLSEVQNFTSIQLQILSVASLKPKIWNDYLNDLSADLLYQSAC